MAGSSMRNALHRRNHKERGQLANRQRLGLLEKKKDYVQRARDYRSKKDRIRLLQEKAATRNKDEFYFAMNSSRTEGGVHVQKRDTSVSIPMDIAKLLKSQDENYIRTMRSAGLKKIEALKAHLATLTNLLRDSSVNDEHIADEFDLGDSELSTLRKAGVIPSSSSSASTSKPKQSSKRKSTSNQSNSGPSHIIFVEDADQTSQSKTGPSRAKMQSDSDEDESTEPTESFDLGWKPDPKTEKARRRAAIAKRKQSLAAEAAAKLVVSSTAEAGAHRTRLLRELSARLERHEALTLALRQAQNQRLRMLNGRKKLLVQKEEGGGEDEEGGSGSKAASKSKKPFSFNMKGSDEEDSDDDERGDGARRGEWKPKVFKFKFRRGN